MIIINPGAGPVEGGTFEQAQINAKQLAEDLGSGFKIINGHPDPFDGRWTFELEDPGKRVHEVEIPGLPIERVRYLGDEGQNIWDFPRLYVDGSSWVWKWALEVIRDAEHA